MQPVERPSDRLPIRYDEIESVQPMSMGWVQHPRHDTVHRERAHGQRYTSFRALHDALHGGLVVHAIHPDSQDVPLGTRH